MNRYTKELYETINKCLPSTFRDNLNAIITKVKSGVTLYCMCLGKSKYQRIFLICLIYFLEPKHTFIYDRDTHMTSYFNQFKNITVYAKDINPQTDVGPNILLYAPYCPFNTSVYTLFKYNLRNIFDNFYYIGIPSDKIFENINTNLTYTPIKPTLIKHLQNKKREYIFPLVVHEYIGQSMMYFNKSTDIWNKYITSFSRRLPKIIKKRIIPVKEGKEFTSSVLIAGIKQCLEPSKTVSSSDITIQIPKQVITTALETQIHEFLKMFTPITKTLEQPEDDIDDLPDNPLVRQLISENIVPEITKPRGNPRYSMWKHWPKIYDQGDTKACAANAYAAIYKFMTEDKTFEPSRMYLFNMTRIPGGGIFPDVMIDYAAKYGIPSAALFTMKKGKLAPREEIEASKRKFGKRFNIKRGPTFKNTINFCISKDIPVMIGFYMYDSFLYMSEKTNWTLIVPSPLNYFDPNDKLDPYLGGHEVVLIGYDDKKQLYEVVNSYGPDWGVQGRFFMPYRYFDNLMLIDHGYVIAPPKQNLLSPLTHMITKFG